MSPVLLMLSVLFLRKEEGRGEPRVRSLFVQRVCLQFTFTCTPDNQGRGKTGVHGDFMDQDNRHARRHSIESQIGLLRRLLSGRVRIGLESGEERRSSVLMVLLIGGCFAPAAVTYLVSAFKTRSSNEVEFSTDMGHNQESC